MYSNREKIAKKGNATTTETEDEVAKALFELENSVKDATVEEIKKIKLSGAQYIGEGEKKILHIMVPYPLNALVRKNHSAIISYLEGKFKCPVAITAQRTILSKYGTFPHATDREEKGIPEEAHEPNPHCGARRLPRRYRSLFFLTFRSTRMRWWEGD